MKIRTRQPVPGHWTAVTDEYDCDCDQDGYYSLSPIGCGATEEAAIQNLLEQMEQTHNFQHTDATNMEASLTPKSPTLLGPEELAVLAGELYDAAEELAEEMDRYESTRTEEQMLDDRERARDMAKELREW